MTSGVLLEPPRRIAYGSGQTLLAELKMVGWDQFQRAVPALGQHVHPQAYEICYIVSGAVDWWVERTMYEVGPGHLFITRPEERHGGSDAMMHPCTLYWAQVEIARQGAMAGLTEEETAQLRQGLDGLNERVFPGSAAVREAFARLLAEHRAPGVLAAAAARASLHALLVGVLRDHARHAQAQRERAAALSPAVRRALGWMDAHEREDYRIEQAAAAVGLSASHFHERFSREVGLSPGEYRTRRRLRLARQLLRGGDRPITEIAFELGFSTSQYFATTFKHFVGMTPRAYRQHSAEGADGEQDTPHGSTPTDPIEP